MKLLGKSDMYFFSPEHPPLTEPAQRALDWAVDQKLKSGIRNSSDGGFVELCFTNIKNCHNILLLVKFH